MKPSFQPSRCRVRSFVRYVLEYEPEFHRIFENLPQIYHEHVELLE